jgi:hypothetical protein
MLVRTSDLGRATPLLSLQQVSAKVGGGVRDPKPQAGQRAEGFVYSESMRDSTSPEIQTYGRTWEPHSITTPTCHRGMLTNQRLTHKSSLLCHGSIQLAATPASAVRRITPIPARQGNDLQEPTQKHSVIEHVRRKPALGKQATLTQLANRVSSLRHTSERQTGNVVEAHFAYHVAAATPINNKFRAKCTGRCKMGQVGSVILHAAPVRRQETAGCKHLRPRNCPPAQLCQRCMLEVLTANLGHVAAQPKSREGSQTKVGAILRRPLYCKCTVIRLTATNTRTTNADEDLDDLVEGRNLFGFCFSRASRRTRALRSLALLKDVYFSARCPNFNSARNNSYGNLSSDTVCKSALCHPCPPARPPLPMTTK